MNISGKIVRRIYRDFNQYRNISGIKPISKIVKTQNKLEGKPFSEILIHTIKNEKEKDK